mmetsp:Transcript_32398/g.58897  ORF Transcript_32398/g.58897 Transcript_32398/m.58897 type:complete len:89 (+) Transcript_32398:1461-1727(+)
MASQQTVRHLHSLPGTGLAGPANFAAHRPVPAGSQPPGFLADLAPTKTRLLQATLKKMNPRFAKEQEQQVKKQLAVEQVMPVGHCKSE